MATFLETRMKISLVLLLKVAVYFPSLLYRFCTSGCFWQSISQLKMQFFCVHFPLYYSVTIHFGGNLTAFQSLLIYPKSLIPFTPWTSKVPCIMITSCFSVVHPFLVITINWLAESQTTLSHTSLHIFFTASCLNMNIIPLSIPTTLACPAPTWNKRPIYSGS